MTDQYTPSPHGSLTITDEGPARVIIIEGGDEAECIEAFRTYKRTGQNTFFLLSWTGGGWTYVMEEHDG